MYSSQQDLFATQDCEKTPSKTYDYVILFDKSGKEKPFAVFHTSFFSKKEIKEKWLTGILDSYSRTKDLTALQQLSEGHFCLFSKIESGMITLITKLNIFNYFSCDFKK